MSKAITYADVERLLTQLGFVAEDTTGSFKVFRHQASDALIVLPSSHASDSVDPSHLVAVRKHVLENGLSDEDSFDALLKGGEPTAIST